MVLLVVLSVIEAYVLEGEDLQTHEKVAIKRIPRVSSELGR